MKAIKEQLYGCDYVAVAASSYDGKIHNYLQVMLGYMWTSGFCKNAYGLQYTKGDGKGVCVTSRRDGVYSFTATNEEVNAWWEQQELLKILKEEKQTTTRRKSL